MINMRNITEVDKFNICREIGATCPKGFWTEDTTKKVLRDLYEKDTITKHMLKTKGLTCILKSNRLDAIVPHIMTNLEEKIEFMTNGEVKIWELPSVPNGYWEHEANVKKYILWLCNKNGWTYAELTKNFRFNLLIRTVSNKYTPEDIIRIAFGDRYSIYEFPISNKYWDNKEHIKKYVKYVLDKHNLSTHEEIQKNIKNSMFKLSILRKYAIWELLNITFPNRFCKWEIGTTKPSTSSELKDFIKWWMYNKKGFVKGNELKTFRYSDIPCRVKSSFSMTEVVKICFNDRYNVWDFEKMQTRWDDEVANDFITWSIEKGYAKKLNNIILFSPRHPVTSSLLRNNYELVSEILNERKDDKYEKKN